MGRALTRRPGPRMLSGRTGTARGLTRTFLSRDRGDKKPGRNTRQGTLPRGLSGTSVSQGSSCWLGLGFLHARGRGGGWGLARRRCSEECEPRNPAALHEAHLEALPSPLTPTFPFLREP